jgi:adenine-specific DNA-methyltransferase
VWAQGVSGDIAYLDPPYNQHQYGSNYHILNSLALWDRLSNDHALNPQGELVRKGGIRPDWKQTKSLFCSKLTAMPALEQLLEDLDARFVVLSYNTEGLIALDDLTQLLEKHGSWKLEVQDYVTYRGGRQSPSRQKHNHEFVLVLDRSARAKPSSKSQMTRFLAQKELAILERARFWPQKLLAAGWPAQQIQGLGVLLPQDWQKASLTQWRQWIFVLKQAKIHDARDELSALLELVDATREMQMPALVKRLGSVLGKIAFAKYQKSFEAGILACQSQEKIAGHPHWPRIAQNLAAKMQKRLAARVPFNK